MKKMIVKIGQYLAKIWTKYDSLLFFGTPCMLLCGITYRAYLRAGRPIRDRKSLMSPRFADRQ